MISKYIYLYFVTFQFMFFITVQCTSNADDVNEPTVWVGKIIL